MIAGLSCGLSYCDLAAVPYGKVVMSQTVIYDQPEVEKKIMDAINAFARHCRIGKVVQNSSGGSFV